MIPGDKLTDWERLGNVPPAPSFAPGLVPMLQADPWPDPAELLEKVGNVLFQLKIIDNVHDARVEFRNRCTLKNAISEEHFSILFFETQVVTRSIVIRVTAANAEKQEAVFVLVNPLWAYRDYSTLLASIDDFFRQPNSHPLISVGCRMKITKFLEARIKEETPMWKVLGREDQRR